MPDINFMASNIAKFPKGSILSAENDAAGRGLFFVLQGSVGVYRNFRMHDELQTGVLNQGDFFGEYPLFLGVDYNATLVALDDTVALNVTRRNLNEFFSSQPDLALGIVENLCRRLFDAESEINKTKGDTAREASRRSSLFPEGHGRYELPLSNDHEVLFEDKTVCPMCAHTFTNLAMITTRLKLDHIDKDMRTRYKGIEPLYYEIITCPKCFFSAQAEAFPTLSKKFAAGVNQKIGPYKLDMYVRTGRNRDTFTVFAGYYLSVLCASVCFDDYQTVTASLWQKLSRLYQDCGDEKMFLYATQESVNDYLYAYEHFNISERQIPQYFFVIGELFTKLGDIDSARDYLYRAKTNRAIQPQLKRQADLRLDELKEMKMKMKTEQEQV